jgi:putative chitinase
MNEYSISTFLRRAHFLAQVCEESDSFCALKEYGNGRDYEGRADLGNTHHGDGARYVGRGLIEVTGRSNYRKIGHLLNLPLEENPDLMMRPDIAVRASCLFWQIHHLNIAADADDIVRATRIVNGGLTGLQTRKLYLARAKAALQNQSTKEMLWTGNDSPNYPNLA